MIRRSALLALADGTVFEGYAIGADKIVTGEVVFNTSMTGYQEILTDPSYAGQMVTFTHPHIGNTGVNFDDNESQRIWAEGLIIRDLPNQQSNWRAELTLDTWLKQQDTVGIAGIDTRKLTRILSSNGAQSGCIITGLGDKRQAISEAFNASSLEGADLAQVVSTKHIYEWLEGSWSLTNGYRRYLKDDLPLHVVVYDFGVKQNILRLLVDRGCRLTVVPANTSAEQVLALKPDGIFLSNGPGDPAACHYAIQATQQILQRAIPLFGICLGCQILALAAGAKTSKMKFGHHGANHPVKDLLLDKVLITSQNHGFMIDEASLPNEIQATHRSLFDNSLQGIQLVDRPAFAFQGHPEASPGPHDIQYLFEQFTQSILASKQPDKYVLGSQHLMKQDIDFE